MSVQLNTIYNEDCLDTMKRMPDNYLHAIVTDPPYGLSFMGKAWDYDVPKVEIWREALRVLKPGGHLLSFAGSRTYHRMAVAIEDAGFEIRDQLIWMYGSGFPKSLNIGKSVEALVTTGNASKNGFSDLNGEKLERGNWGISAQSKKHGFRAKNYDTETTKTERIGQLDPTTDEAKLWNGYGTALKPSHEPCVLARKPIDKGMTVAGNVLKHGTGGLNIDGTRVGETGARTNSNGKRSMYGGNSLLESKTHNDTTTEHNYGRFPANLIHDGSEEVVGLFPQSKSGSVNGKYGHSEGFASGEIEQHYQSSSGSAARFFYCAKASKRERGQGNNHPTVKPIALMKYLVKLVAPPKNGIIYDPFSGSGTTLLACQKLGIDFIGSEISKEYCEIAEERLRH